MIPLSSWSFCVVCMQVYMFSNVWVLMDVRD